MKKYTLLAALSISLHLFSFSQVKIKNDTVRLDGEIFMTLKSDLIGTTFTDLKGNDLIFLSVNPETEWHPAYTKIIFLKEKIMLTNQSLFISRKSILNMLIRDKVLVDTIIQKDALDIFILKFNEVIPIYTKIVVDSEN